MPGSEKQLPRPRRAGLLYYRKRKKRSICLEHVEDAGRVEGNTVREVTRGKQCRFS